MPTSRSEREFGNSYPPASHDCFTNSQSHAPHSRAAGRPRRLSLPPGTCSPPRKLIQLSSKKLNHHSDGPHLQCSPSAPRPQARSTAASNSSWSIRPMKKVPVSPFRFGCRDAPCPQGDPKTTSSLCQSAQQAVRSLRQQAAAIRRPLSSSEASRRTSDN